MKTINRSK